MPAPVSLTLRRRILARCQQGRDPADIACELALAPRTVRRLCQLFREHGVAALEPSYHRPSPPVRSPALEQALLLHEEHPSWGAVYVLLRLEQLQPGITDLPKERTLQRRFRESKRPPAPPGRKPASTRRGAQRPHEVWQMDAVEPCPLQTGQKISWLRWVDEYSGAVLGTVVFPLRDVRPSAGDRSGPGSAPAISAVGPACPSAGRQRHAVGQLERFADAVRFVGRRLGRRLALERSAQPATKSENRACARNGQTLG